MPRLLASSLIVLVPIWTACGPSAEDGVAKRRICECLAAHDRIATAPPERATGAQMMYEGSLRDVSVGLDYADHDSVRALVEAECPRALSMPCGAGL